MKPEKAYRQTDRQQLLFRACLIIVLLSCLAVAACKDGGGGSDSSSGPSGDPDPGPVTHSLTYTAGAHGSITGASSQTVNQGADGHPVSAAAATGYHFVKWSDNSTANPRTDTNVTSDISVSASFAINSYTLTYTAGANGSITGSSPQTVTHGADGSPVTAVAAAGHHFINWSDGSTANPRTDSYVTGDISVSAGFALDLAPPANVRVTSGKGQVSLSWDPVPNATGYELCYARESITDFANCAGFNGGTRVLDVTSPYTVTGLADGVQYYFRVAATLNGKTGTPSAEVSTTPEFAPVGGLNDSGVDWCADGSTNYATGTAQNKADNCTAQAASYPGQDGMLGRDAQARQDTINGTNTLGKIGAGAAGFDFTRVCNSGDIAGAGSCPAAPGQGNGANDWGCTRDNVTGLVWEVKTDNGDLRDRDNTYSWYNTVPATNGGAPGTANGSPTCTGSDCDTQSYVAAVKAANLCGGSDWRLPSATELQSIIHYGRAGLLPVDLNFFPNTSSSSYWSSSPYSNSNAHAWVAEFSGGSLGNSTKSISYNVRLVRAGHPAVSGATVCAITATKNSAIISTTPTTNFTLNADGTAGDSSTRLMWKRCSQGQTWDAGTQQCTGTAQYYSWKDALAQAATENAGGFAGHNDWRLPNVKELTSIVERRCYNPSINAAVFHGTQTLGYWSSSPKSNGTSWYVHFQTGHTNAGANNTSLYVRLVRSRQ